MSTSAVAQAPPPPPGFNPVAQDFLTDPYPLLERARRECPVFFSPELGFWGITRYADVEAALADWETFSNHSLANIPVPEEFADRVPADWFATGALISQDPPEHTVRRKFINQGFARRRMAVLAEPIEEIANTLIDGFVATGECDIMTQYCYEVSLRSIVALLGMPTDDLPLLRQLADDQGAVVSGAIKPMPHEEVMQRWGRIVEARKYLSAVAESRRANPGEEMVSVIASARDDNGDYLLSTDQIVSHLTELIFAGTDTTANLMAHMVLLLEEHPDQLGELRADPSLWPQAIEEGLRRRTPGIGIFRITKRETEVAGVTIPAGAFVWLALAAADHDEAVFADPRRFDIHRANAEEHISFGKGRHFCPGSPLTRLEAPIGLRVLYDRLRGLRVVPGQTLEYDPVLAAVILKHLRVRCDA